MSLCLVSLMMLLAVFCTSEGKTLHSSQHGPKFNEEPQFRIEFSNSTGIQIPCNATGQPKPEISWILLDGGAVSKIQGLREIRSDGTLVLFPFKAEDYRQDVHTTAYRCVATNLGGTIISREVHVKAVMLQQYDLQVYDAFAIKGNTAVLKCHVPDFITERVHITSWIKDNVVRIEPTIKETGKYIVTPSGELYVMDLSNEDVGSSFRCQATHRLTHENRISATAGRLFVTEPKGNVPPQILAGPTNILIKEGEEAVLPCPVQGHPIPSTTWLLKRNNGKIHTIKTNEKYVISKISLILRNSDNTDSGTYICSVKNTLGNDRREINITVIAPLKVQISPSEVKLKGDFPYELHCLVSGFPVNDLFWMRNGVAVSSPNNDIKEVISVQKGGMYQCFAVNDHDMAQGTSQVYAGEKVPVITTHFTNKTMKPGNILHLQCTANGIPLPSITWFHDEIQLVEQSRISIDTKTDGTDRRSSSLKIKDTKVEDGGFYKCVAANNLEEVEYSARINIFGKLGIRKMTRIATVAGKNLTINCPYFGYPVRTLEWSKDGKKLPLHSRQYAYRNGTLSIAKVQKNVDSGKYVCIAKNDEGETIQEDVDIAVMNSPKIMPFSFQEDLLREGMRARLQCVVSEGDTPIVMKWNKDGDDIPKDSGIIVRQLDEFSSILTINNVVPRHNGNYTCEASNDLSTTKHTATLHVNAFPKIIPFSFQEKFVAEGTQARVLCGIVEGDPPLTFSWFRNGLHLEESSDITIKQIDTQSNILIIARVSPDDMGNYTCVVSNKAATSNFTAELIINVAPKIIPFSFQADHLFEGVLARVSCVVYQGDLPIAITWTKDNLPLNKLSGINIRNLDDFSSSLTIENVHPIHSGDYTCIARNAAASANFTATLSVNVPPKIVPFTFQDDQLLEGMLVRVSCVISRGDLPLNITWLKDGQSISTNQSVTVKDFDEYSSVLSIDPASSRHNGNYTCIATNTAGSISYSTSLTVKVPPKWIEMPTDSTVFLGKEILIPCLVDGFPKPTVTWLREKDGKDDSINRIPVNIDPSMQVLPNGSLHITSAKASHEGYYFCDSDNGIGILGKTISLKVQSPPIFAQNEYSIVVRRGEKIHLRCEANGDKPIHFSWEVYGDEIGIDKKSRYSLHENQNVNNSFSELIISEAENKDTTVFTCKARNAFGTDEAKYNVTVKGFPGSPIDLRLSDTYNGSVVVAWKSGYNGNSRILQYIIQYKSVKGNWKENVQNLTVKGDASSYSISGLRPSTKYQVRILAVNEIGPSEPSPIIDVKVAEEAPSAPPQEVIVMGTDSNTLKVSWKPPRKEHWNGIIRGYYVGYKLAGGSDYYTFKLLEVPEDYNDALSLQLAGLQKYTQYNIVVQAFNDGGKGPLSKEVTIITSESVPTKSPQDVRCSVLTSQSIHITWQPPPSESVHGLLQGYRVLYVPENRMQGRVRQDIKTTTTTKLTLQNLYKYTNYSIQVLGFTRRGDGVKSSPIFCHTLEDIPDAPDEVKALSASPESIIVTWKAPKNPNGIIVKYTVYIKNGEETPNKYAVRGNITHHEVTGLHPEGKYEFTVSASTVVGEGPRSNVQVQSPSSKGVAAKLASFDSTIITSIDKDIKLLCRAVGFPKPVRKWIRSGNSLELQERMNILSDGSLIIKDIQREDGDNYTCHVENEHGSDEVTYSVIVQTPPDPVNIEVALSTSSSIEIQWKPSNEGGSPILGYVLHYRVDQGSWEAIHLEATVFSYQLENLHCGTIYEVNVQAFNKIGKGKSSITLRASTKGGVPIIPSKQALLEESSNFVTVNLNSWVVESCSIKYFVLEYKTIIEDKWKLFSDEIKPDKQKVVITDLMPARWYNLRVVAHSSAGSTAEEYTFATLTLNGATIQPETSADESKPGSFSELIDMKMIISVSVGLVVLAIVVTSILIACNRSRRTRRPHRRHRGGKQSRGPGKSKKQEDDGYVDGSFTYMHARDDTRRVSEHRKSGKEDDLTPYATAHLSDYRADGKSGSHSVIKNKNIKPVYPQISKPPSEIGNISCPSTADIANLKGLQHFPSAPPMSDAYGGNSAAFYSPVFKHRPPVHATPSRSILPPPIPPFPENLMSNVINQRLVQAPNENTETTFIFNGPPAECSVSQDCNK